MSGGLGAVIVLAVFVVVMAVTLLPVSVIVTMDVLMIVVVVVQALTRAGTARVFAEHERLDRHRHGV